MSDTGFRITLVTPQEDTVVVEVSGEVDICTCTSMREQVLKAIDGGARLVVIDLEDVPFMDSSGLSCLVGAAHRAQSAACTLVLAAVGARVRKVIHTTGIDRILPLLETRAEALAL